MMMSRGPHHCYRNGALVSASGVIPGDPADYLWSAGLREVGCNAIRCGACHSPVVAEAPGPRGERRYACACTSKIVHARRFLDGQPEDRPDGLVPESWGCGGHVPRALPITLDGVEVEATPDWGAWVARAARGELRPLAPPGWLPTRKHTWLERLLATVAPSERERFAAMVVSTLDGGAEGAGVAIDLAQRLALGEVGRALVSRVAAGAIDWSADPARTRAIVALLEQVAYGADDGTLLAALRHTLLAAPSASGMIYALARRDPAWLADQAAAVIAANPAFTDRLLSALGEASPSHVAVALERLITAGLGPRADLERAVARSIASEDVAAWLARLEGIAP